MPGTVDDRRAASTITASLSSYLMTAALGVIAAEAVIVAFAFDKREHLLWFDLFSALGLAASTASIYFGGKGIGELTRRGLNGDWVVQTYQAHFNRQASLALASILFVSLSVFCGKPKAERPGAPEDYRSLHNDIRELQKRISDVESWDQAISTRLDALASSEKKRPRSSDRRKR
jgi:hypothetical protein